MRRVLTETHMVPRDAVRFVELLLSIGCTQFQVCDKRRKDGVGVIEVSYLSDVETKANKAA